MSEEMETIRRASSYLGTLLRRYPEDADWLWDQKNLLRRYAVTDLYNDLTRTVQSAASWADVQVAFRRFKQRHFLRIGARDLLGRADLVETTAQLSDLAQVSLEAGLQWLKEHPHLWAPRALIDLVPDIFYRTSLTVLGLGKLGGRELNYVSDVDLLFLREDKHGSPSEADFPKLYETLCLLCQKLVNLLADSVEGDRVFHVDLRLRPHGKDGELVPRLAAATSHYLLHGQAWERQMLLKARPVAGDRALGTAFLQEVRPFVFRRFLDFQALDELRDMRDRILQEHRCRRHGEPFDVKLGIGGIREVEFLVQSFQLIYGGRIPELDEPNTLAAMEKLKSLNLLPAEAADELRSAYIFLRRVEHWIQLDQNRQTQKIPVSSEARRRLAEALGFDGDGDRFRNFLEAHSQTVHKHFTALFESDLTARSRDGGDSKEETSRESARGEGVPFWEERIPSLAGLPKHLASGILQAVKPFLDDGENPWTASMAARVERYLAQVRRRPGLLHFLASHKASIRDVFPALLRCELVADLLGRQPSLVEALSSWDRLDVPHEQWEASAQAILDKVSSYEERLEWLRRLKNERFFLLSLADLAGLLGHEALERVLSDLADFVVRRTLDAVMDAVGLDRDLPLAVIALGSLGSRELDYLSDLDLMFVYEPRDGEKADQIPVPVIRMLQRFMRMLSTPLQEGPGYNVDARLRPTGSYGPLVVTRTTWEDYYTTKADIWEIQALLRFRPVAGEPRLGSELQRIQRRLCFERRDPERVWPRLCSLRKRMEEERTAERDDAVDIKLGPGGLTDLEFLTQGVQLIHSHEHPALQQGSTKALLAEALPFVPDGNKVAEDMVEAFTAYRNLEHRMHLMTHRSGSLLSRNQFLELGSLSLWPPAAESRRIQTWEDLLAARRRVRRLFHGLCGRWREDFG